MRKIEDDDGRCWDVFVGKASYGELMLMFACRNSDEVRSYSVAADNQLEAERTLAKLTETELHERLRRAAEGQEPPPAPAA